LVATLGNFAFTDWGNVSLTFILATLALAISVGFAEEFVCRGMLLVGLRGSTREVVAWALSCLFFGLMHSVNILLGAPASGTIGQIISSAMAGSTFYLLRRYFGSLLPAMILHGLYDMSVFNLDHSGGQGSYLSLLEWPGGIIAVFAGLVVALRTDKGQQESYAHGASAPAPATV
jgi:CAAX protease family protein